MDWKPLSDPVRGLGFFPLIPWVKTGDDGLPKMFEGIIPKEYPNDCTEYTIVMVISQWNQTKDSEEKQPVQDDLQKSVDSQESG